MKDLDEEKIIKEDKNRYRCNICNSQEDYLLCDSCFKEINKEFEEQRNNFINTGKLISKKIDLLLTFNIEKSKKLNKKIYLEKYKQILESRIKLEETKVNLYQEQLNKYEQQIINQKDKNNGLLHLLKEYNNSKNMDDSGINKDNDNNNNNDITKIKNEIFNINAEIKKYKKKYIDDLFQQYFITKKSIIKIADFFNDEQTAENNLNFSIINIPGKQSNEFDNSSVNKIKLDELENEDLLKRFNSFFKSMVSFLENAYNKFKIKMPFKINNSKIEYKKGFEYNIEIKKNELNNPIAISNVIKGYHLLNINYKYLMENVYGDSIKLGNWFDVLIFLPEQNDDIGSIKSILEDAKNDKKEDEYNGFVIIDD